MSKSKLLLIIGILILGIGLFVSTKLVQKNQENRSKASEVPIGDDYCNLNTEGKLACTDKKVNDYPDDLYKTGAVKNYPNQIEYRWTCGSARCAFKGPVGTSNTSRCGTTQNTCKTGSVAYQKPNDLYQDKKTGEINTNPTDGIRIEHRWSCVSGGYTEICKKTVEQSVCAKSNWVEKLVPSTCPTSGKQTKTWISIGNCKGGTTKPADKIINCTYSNNVERSNQDWETFSLTFYTSTTDADQKKFGLSEKYDENGPYESTACGYKIKDVKPLPGKQYSKFVASNYWGCGTKIYLEGYGEMIVADTGGKNFNLRYRLDVLIPRDPSKESYTKDGLIKYYNRVNSMGTPKVKGYIVK